MNVEYLRNIRITFKTFIPVLAAFGFIHPGLRSAFGQDASIASPKTASPITLLSEISKIEGGFQFTEGPTQGPENSVYFTDIPANQIKVWKHGGAVATWIEPSMHANGLMYETGGRLLACQMDGQVVAYDLSTKQSSVLASQFQGQRFNAPNDLIVDDAGGLYFTDPLYRAPQPLPQKVQAVYYVSNSGEVSRVSGDLPAPNGIGLSPDGKLLYVAPSMSSEMLVFDVLSPGKLSEPRVFCKLQQKEEGGNSGGDGLTVDTQGNLYFTTESGVQIFGTNGKWLQTIEFPEHPANVAFAGPERNMLVVTARTGVYSVKLSTSGLEPKRLRIESRQ